MTGQDSATAIRPPSFQDGGAAVFDWLRTMRGQHPVHRDQHGVWHLFRHADVSRAINDPGMFSSDQSRVMPDAARWTRGNLNSIDPPAHRDLRRLVSQAFTPHVVDSLRPRIVRVCDDLLDGVADVDEWDVVDALARPLPVIVIAQLLGIPDSDRELLGTWSDRLLSTQLDYRSPAESAVVYERATQDLNQYLLEHCRDRRRYPRDDLISNLVTAEAEGRRLADVEVINFAGLLLMAGHISTTALLGNTVLCLQENPHAAEEVRADRDLVPALIEEVLRYRSPFAMVGRFTTVDVHIGDQIVPAGSVVTPWLLSANHDERQFEDPERFDLHRDPKPRLAFGHGVHFCLGAPLARLEARVALAALLDRFADVRVAPGSELAFHEHSIFAAKSIPVTVRRETTR